jgi:hypothetical protein
VIAREDGVVAPPPQSVTPPPPRALRAQDSLPHPFSDEAPPPPPPPPLGVALSAEREEEACARTGVSICTFVPVKQGN